jgi:hypothetical protein
MIGDYEVIQDHHQVQGEGGQMSRKVMMGIILALFIFPASAAPQDGEFHSQIFGLGRLSCSTWKLDYTSQGSSWILGYWTGRNFQNSAHHMVGENAKSVGILNQITRYCAANPSTPLIQAINSVYGDFEKSGE